MVYVRFHGAIWIPYIRNCKERIGRAGETGAGETGLILTDVKMPGMDGLDFAEKAHEGQFRKGTKRPYIVHPLEVAKIVSTMTDDEEIISAALLHDTLEDCRQVTKEQIKEAFGERVLEMVRQESEDKSKTWWREKVRQSDI